ncbi:MAG: hypothetical protein KC502_19395 [Myxococcales bacterium]|nr:hypothetical protein [Myxococcales bacterium]
MGKKLADLASSLGSQTASRQLIYIVDFENIPKTDVAELLSEPRVRMVVLAANRTNTVTPSTLRTIEANPERVDVIIGRITRKEFVDKLVTAKIGEYAFRFPNAEIIVLANDKDYKDLTAHLNDHWERPVPIRHVAPALEKQAGGARKKPAKDKAATQDGSRAGGQERRGRKSRAGAKDAEGIKGQRSSKRTEKSAAVSSAKSTATGKPKQRSDDKSASQAKPESSRRKKSPATTTAKAPSKATPTKASSSKSPADKPTKGTARALSGDPDVAVIISLLAKMPARRRPKSPASLLNAIRNYREAMGLRARPTTILKHLTDGGVVASDGNAVTYALPAAE